MNNIKVNKHGHIGILELSYNYRITAVTRKTIYLDIR